MKKKWRLRDGIPIIGSKKIEKISNNVFPLSGFMPGFSVRDCRGKPAGTRTCNVKPAPLGNAQALNEFLNQKLFFMKKTH